MIRRRVAMGALAVLAGGLLSLACGTARSSTGPERNKPKPYVNPTAGRDVAYQIVGMHRARVRRGLTYSGGGPTALRMDVYRPRLATSAPLGAVLIGGPPAFNAGKDTGQKIGWGQLVAATGLAAVVFDIRSDSFQATPAQPSADVAAAIEYVRANATRLGIDPERLCTLGFSIGTAPWHLWATMKDRRPYIRCNVVYYGPLDFQGSSWSIAPADVAEYSALTYLKRDGRNIAPMLIVKAGRDQFEGINDSIDRFVAEAQRVGAPVELRVHPTGFHSFDLGVRQKRTLSIMKDTLAFLKRRLARSG